MKVRAVSDAIPTVSVFGVTGGAAGKKECRAIAAAVREAARQIGTLRLLVFGRHADTAEDSLRDALRDCAVDLHVSGVLPADQVAERLCSSDVLLFVRGPISTRRGSAIAGIACGLPVIACAGKETAPPITEAGVVLVSATDHSELGDALSRVLRDDEYRRSLAQRSREAQRKYFSWGVIADAYVQAMDRLSCV